MSAPTRFTRTSAVIGLVVALGCGVLPSTGLAAGPDASPSPAASPASAPRQLPDAGALQAGTYFIPAGPLTPARLDLTVPEGYSTFDGFIAKGVDLPAHPAVGWDGDVMLVTWIVSHVYADACKGHTLVDVGTTVDGFVAALAAQEGRQASAPTLVTVGGFPATRIELSVPADIDLSACDGLLHFWPDPGPDIHGGLCCGRPGSTDVVYAVDVNGDRLVIVARRSPGATEQELAELQGMVDSIRLEAPSATPGTSAAP